MTTHQVIQKKDTTILFASILSYEGIQIQKVNKYFCHNSLLLVGSCWPFLSYFTYILPAFQLPGTKTILHGIPSLCPAWTWTRFKSASPNHF